jgi:hypothetical protein
LMATFAFGTAAPVASFTVPSRVPVTACPTANWDTQMNIARKAKLISLLQGVRSIMETSRSGLSFGNALYIVRRTNKRYHSLDQACQGNNSEFEQKNLGFSQDGEQAIPPFRTEPHTHGTHSHRAHLENRCLLK